MSKSAQVPLLKSVDISKTSQSVIEKIKTRRAKELVIAFCGPVGSGIKDVVDKVKSELETTYKYDVIKIKVSDLIKKYITKVDPAFDIKTLRESAQRYIKLQDAGNKLREKLDNVILGQFTIEAISLDREKRTIEKKDSSTSAEDDKSSHRVAYLIDSLKHPAEVDLLRAVYRNIFYLFGIFCPDEKRRKNLINEDMKASDAQLIMERDEKQDEEFGQHLVDTLQYADFFINNDHPNIESIKVDRFLDLMLDTKILSPTLDEFAMYIAQSAALRSGCLSRQIGAAIINKEGEIISVGYNDVPKSGGLYSCEDGDNDLRCVHMGNECQSSKYKDKIKSKIEEILSEELHDKERVKGVAHRIATESKINDLLEFSRAVHAEMEAIVSAARIGVSPKGGTLYCTTFPCHTCARHILAAGIKKVLFIEPYAKSLAMKLHGEAIVLEPPLSQQGQEEVIFSHFEGVAPRQYLNLFKARKERKKDGKGTTAEPDEAIPALPEYLDSWTEVEAKVVEDLRKRLEAI